MHPPRVSRAKGFTYVGMHRYFVTICTAKRFPAFTSEAVVDPIRSIFLQLAEEIGFAVVAYCFMPDHLHVLVEGTSEAADLPQFISRAKQSTGYRFKKQFGQQLWQVGYYDRVLRDGEATLAVARYLVENPVRAGLVADPMAYPFLDCPACGLKAVLEAIQFKGTWGRKAKALRYSEKRRRAKSGLKALRYGCEEPVAQDFSPASHLGSRSAGLQSCVPRPRISVLRQSCAPPAPDNHQYRVNRSMASSTLRAARSSPSSTRAVVRQAVPASVFASPFRTIHAGSSTPTIPA